MPTKGARSVADGRNTVHQAQGRPRRRRGCANGARGRVKSGDFLHTDLEHRGATGNVRFGVMALLDGPGDSTMDVTIRWR